MAVRIHAGDARAEEEFVAMFERRVRAFALVNLSGGAGVDELVQDVLWAVIRALREGRVEKTEQLAAFVFGTARNLLNAGFRSRAREKLTPLADVDFPCRPQQEEFERNHAAQQAIAKLEPHERIVLMLSLVEGLNHDQIGERLGMQANAVRQRKARALRKLAEILRPESQKPGPHLLKGVDTR